MERCFFGVKPQHACQMGWAHICPAVFVCFPLRCKKNNSAQRKVQSTRQLSAIYFQKKKTTKPKVKHLMKYPKIFLNLEGYEN